MDKDVQSSTPLSASSSQESNTATSTSLTSSLPDTSNESSQEQVIVETITAIRAPMMRPKPELLQVIKLGGGIGDVFSLRQIIHHVKEYIGQRLLFDILDPRLVYCDALLGEALGVGQFTITEAIGLFQRNSTLVNETCTRLCRNVEVQSPHLRRGETLQRRETNTLISPESHSRGRSSGADDLQISDTTRTVVNMKQKASGNSGRNAPANSSSNPSQARLSEHHDGGSASTQLASKELSNSTPSQSTSSQVSSSLSSSTSINVKAAVSSVAVSDKDIQSSRHSTMALADSSSDSENRKPPHSKGGRGERKCSGTSLNLRLDEPDGDADFTVQVQMAEGQNGDDNVEDTLVLEYESDAFSVEYEVESSSDGEGAEQDATITAHNDPSTSIGLRSRTVSEVSSCSSGCGTRTAMLVVCQESDVEYLADYSDTDTGSDAELTDADKWQCQYCSVKNPPFQRNCGACWGVRSNWLPRSTTSSPNITDSSSTSAVVLTAIHSQNECFSIKDCPGQVPSRDVGIEVGSKHGGDWDAAVDNVKDAPSSSMFPLKEAKPGDARARIEVEAGIDFLTAGSCDLISDTSSAALEKSEAKNDNDEHSCKDLFSDTCATSVTGQGKGSLIVERQKTFHERTVASGSGIIEITDTSDKLSSNNEAHEINYRTDDKCKPQNDKYRHHDDREHEGSRKELQLLKFEALKRIAASTRMRAQKRHYSSSLSTSDSPDDCSKQKVKSKSEREDYLEPNKGEKADACIDIRNKGDVNCNHASAKTMSCEANGRSGKHKAVSKSNAESREDTCVVCLTRRKTACIIHGKTGHQVCCYRCAKKLKKQRKPCPICRRPIQKVIRNFHL